MSGAQWAKPVEELVDYEGPQVLLLKSQRSLHMFAVAITRKGMERPFFACEVRDKTYDKYFEETADLHYVFREAVLNNYYFFDLATVEKEQVKLIRATAKEAADPAYWPQVGFFSRSHTTQFGRSKSASTIRTFKIDGKWAADDFSYFNGKMSDLYALFGVLARTDTASERGFMREAIQDRFWQRGGSYHGFYGSLEKRNRAAKLTPLEVAKIQYASPGEIALRGNKKAMSEISDIIEVFIEKADGLSTQYNSIKAVLKKERLLSAPPTKEFSSRSMGELVAKKSREFAADMQVERIDEIYEACDRNKLVFSKVILSIYRRARDVYKFHAEGRVQRID